MMCSVGSTPTGAIGTGSGIAIHLRMPYIRCMRKSKYTKELLEPIVKDSTSLAGVIRKLGLKPSGGTHRYLKGYIAFHGISTEHFTGKAWNKGKTKDTSAVVAAIASKNSLSDDEVFVENSSYNPSKLRPRLLRMGWVYECSICRLSDWLGAPITLHVDHINGRHSDHRLENLRFLCPNCHQQTSTWGNRTNTNWPSLAVLQEMVNLTNLSVTADYLGVTVSAVRSRMKRHQAPMGKSAKPLG